LLQAAGGHDGHEPSYQAQLASAVKDVVRQQHEHGLDLIDDGEFGKPDFVGYVNERLAGFTRGSFEIGGGPRRDMQLFPQYYTDANRARGGGALSRMYPPLICTGPVRYVGQAVLQRDIDNLRSAAAGLH